MKGKITVLVENSSTHGLAVEHGLSFLIETGGHRILFDTGQSAAFLQNAAGMGLPLDTVDTVILSHAHYDHANGLPNLFGLVPSPDIYIGPDFFLPKYARESGDLDYKGPNFTNHDLVEAGWSVHTVGDSPHPLYGDGSGLWLCTDFPRVDPLETIPDRFVRRDPDGSIIPDPFTDEIMLVAETSKGLLLVAGCSHPGIVNMIESVRTTFDQPIYGVIGGTHLKDASDDRISHVGFYLKELGLSLLGIAHCSGDRTLEFVRSLGISPVECGSGTVIGWD